MKRLPDCIGGHGLAPLPESDPKLREKLNEMSLDNLRVQLSELDPETAERIDLKNRRRVMRALEICVLTGKPASAQRRQSSVAASLCEAQTARANEIPMNASRSETATEPGSCLPSVAIAHQRRR